MNTLTTTTTGTPIHQQAHSDQQLLALWLHGKSEHTQAAYAADIERLLAAVQKPLPAVTLGDLQAFEGTLGDLSPASRKRTLSAVKSLLTFGQRLGYLQFNVGAALSIPKAKSTLAERILTEGEVHAMIALTTKQRDQLLLRVLYASAGRVSEVCSLTWADAKPNGDSGQLTLFGKGSKTRAVKLSKATWQALLAYRQGAADNAPIFASQKGGHLDPSQVHRIVREAAKRAGIVGNVSPHWLRHSHATHALERGASLALLRDTLGHSSSAVTGMYLHAKPTDSSALYLGI